MYMVCHYRYLFFILATKPLRLSESGILDTKSGTIYSDASLLLIIFVLSCIGSAVIESK